MAEIYETLKASLARERPVALATLVGGAGARASAASESAETQFPQAPAAVGVGPAGAKLLAFQDGATQGTLGNERLDARVAEDARQMIWRGDAKTITYEDEALPEAAEVFIEAFPPPHKLVIVGAGHIAIPLTTFGKTLGYRVIVVDARAVFATRER